MAAFLNFRLLGGFDLTCTDRSVIAIKNKRLQSLLAYLVLNCKDPISRRQLAYLFWPDSSESQARTNLRNLIHLLRLALPCFDDFLSIDSSMIQWKPDSSYAVDVIEFETNISAGYLQKAISIYTSELLPDCYDDWAAARREYLRQIYFDALLKVMQQKKVENDYQAAIGYARLLIQLEPLNEQTYCELMDLFALEADRVGVIRTYSACIRALKNELDIDPSPKTQEMFDGCQRRINMENHLPYVWTKKIKSESNFKEIKMMHPDIFTIILAGGGKAFKILKDCPTQPSFVFDGNLRAINFVLSNLITSDLNRIAVLTQPNSMIENNQTVKEKLFSSYRLQLPQIQLWEPSLERTGHERYVGTADAVFQNRKFILEENREYVLILAGDHIYRQDYRDLLRYHIEKSADLTIAITTVLPKDSHRYGMIAMAKDQRITHFVEKPEKTEHTLASLGIYVFNTSFLLSCLENDARNEVSRHDFGRDIIPSLIDTHKVYAYYFNGFWTDIATFA